MIEAKCYRRFHHAGDVPGSAFRYRSREEEAEYAGREVTRVLPEAVQEAGILSADEVAHIRRGSEQAVLAGDGRVRGQGRGRRLGSARRGCGRGRRPRPRACAAPAPNGGGSPSWRRAIWRPTQSSSTRTPSPR